MTNRDLPVPAEAVDALSPYGPVLASDNPRLPADAVYHIPSPFEPAPLNRLWPENRRGQPLYITLHDMIPAVFQDQQMPDAAVRRAYWARAQLIRQADRVLSVSRSTARDATRLIGVRENKIVVTGGGVSDDFRPPKSRSQAREQLCALRPAVDEEFVLYTGGMDYHKNIAGLLRGYARLPQDLRRRHNEGDILRGVDGHTSERAGHDDPGGPFAGQAKALGIADRVIFAGFVTDEELVLLYQAASLFVFPSLYEGFGLPVVEALACGAPTLAGRNSSLVELVEDEALFDASDTQSIADALEHALGDERLRQELCRPEIRDRFSWARIAELTQNAYNEADTIAAMEAVRDAR